MPSLVHLTLYTCEQRHQMQMNINFPVWIVAIIVLLPFVAVSSTVLVTESRRSPTDRCRQRCLGAMAILVIGIACTLSVAHVASM